MIEARQICKTMKNKITAKTILNLLLEKHNKDFCVPECKTGSTWFSKKLYIMDLWVMKKSWSKPYTYCYEIKVSRQNFLKDEKWREYLKYCTDFYFVAPPGIINANELNNEAGLIITSVNGKRLYTKKKAIPRNVKIPEDLYKYILMWRSIQRNEKEIISAKNYWKIWLNEKKIDYEFGHNVSRKIKETINKEINKKKVENNILKAENYNLQEVKKIMLDFGFKKNDLTSSYYSLKYDLEEKIKREFNKKDLKESIKKSILDLQKTLTLIEE